MGRRATLSRALPLTALVFACAGSPSVQSPRAAPPPQAPAAEDGEPAPPRAPASEPDPAQGLAPPSEVALAERASPPSGDQSAVPPAVLDELAAGAAALREERLSDAREHYERAAAAFPGHPDAELGRLRVRWAALALPTAYAEAPHHPELERLVEMASAILSKHPDYPPALLERGRLLLVLGEASAAIDDLARAAARDAGNAEARSALGVAYLATGEAQKALVEFEASARLEPHEPERLTNLGTAYMLRGRVSEAIATYQRALALRPDDARTHGDLGAAYLADSRVDQAVVHLERANALAPGRATFLTNLGYAYQRQGQLDKALETQRRAIAIDPKLGSAWLNLGNALAERGQYDEAEKALRHAQSLDPTDPRPRASLDDLAQLRAYRKRPAPP